MKTKKSKFRKEFDAEFLAIADIVWDSEAWRLAMREGLSRLPEAERVVEFLDLVSKERAGETPRGQGRPKDSEETRRVRATEAWNRLEAIRLLRRAITEGLADELPPTAMKDVIVTVAEEFARRKIWSRSRNPLLWATRTLLQWEGKPHDEQAGKAELDRLRKAVGKKAWGRGGSLRSRPGI